MRRLTIASGYLGPSLDCAGVCYFLPGLTIGVFESGGGYVSAGWLFWYASITWPARASG